jgi:hypothetical protein
MKLHEIRELEKHNPNQRSIIMSQFVKLEEYGTNNEVFIVADAVYAVRPHFKLLPYNDDSSSRYEKEPSGSIIQVGSLEMIVSESVTAVAAILNCASGFTAEGRA